MDFNSYAPLFVRLAWHCAGSYRESDGRGGCDGARIRYTPELEWADNTNLDKARHILDKVKRDNVHVSWGDLIVLAGNVALESMGVDMIGYCGGRIDDDDGKESLVLGPSRQQEIIAPCVVNGTFNPEGPMGKPDPKGSAENIRDSFGRMGMNDRETVALIGGGHAFGKAHGACPDGPGNCGEGPMKGMGPNTFTSGFEGSWTTTPTLWSNQYFQSLLKFEWEKFIGPAGHWQWKPKDSNLNIRFLTADIALINDNAYLKLVQEYASNITSLERDFATAWYKLTSRDVGPSTRCKGSSVPPPQPFQLDVPSPTSILDPITLEPKIKALIASNNETAALLVTLAYQCASTFRQTDYSGGCNGARIRFPPESLTPENKGLDAVLSLLAPLKQSSWSDLIVYAASVALDTPFTGGRGDVSSVDAQSVRKLAPRTYYPSQVLAIKDSAAVMGLSLEEYVSLIGRPRSLKHEVEVGYKGVYTDSPRLSNTLFKILKWYEWKKVGNGYVADGDSRIVVRESDFALLQDPELEAIVVRFGKDKDVFLKVFKSAWRMLISTDHEHH